MRTYGVTCDATDFVAFVGHAISPEDACVRATKDAAAAGTLGRFHRSVGGPPHDSEQACLELSVYDVPGLLEPIPNVDIDDRAAMDAMNEETHLDQYIARQY